jgi:hypothetical protein
MAASHRLLLACTVLSSCAGAFAGSSPPLAAFDGGIGVDPVTNAGPNTNVVRGVPPGGVAWRIGKLKATIGADGSIAARGKGLLFAAGDRIGTRGPITAVVATLACGPANATATLFTSAPAPLDLAGDFNIGGVLSQDGVNAAVMPATCDNPALLIRSFAAATGPGNWFAAGIPGRGDD